MTVLIGNIWATYVQLIMQQLFIFLCVPGAILDSGDTGVNKSNIISSLSPWLPEDLGAGM